MPKLNFWVDVEDLTPATTGAGPITNVQQFRVKRRMNRAGDWRMIVPATDPRVADLLSAERTIQCYGIVNGVKAWMGGGIIQRQRMRIRGNDIPLLEVSGVGLLGELARDTVGVLNLTGTGDDNLDDILDTLPAGWGSTVTGTTGDFTARFVHENTLNALVSVAEKLDVVFRIEESGGSIRELSWYNTLPSVASVQLSLNVDPQHVDDSIQTAVIVDIQELEDSSGLVNHAIVYGAGTGESRLDLTQATAATHVWSDDSTNLSSSYIDSYGYTHSFDVSDGSIQSDTSIALYGTHKQAIAFKDIAPITNNTGDFNAAINMLVKSASIWLSQRQAPVKTYSMAVGGLQTEVLPGAIVFVDARVYRDGEAPIFLNRQQLKVLETETLIDADGARVVQMLCSTVRKWPGNDAEMIVSDARKNQVYEALPQMGPNIDTISHMDEVDDANAAQFYFWLNEETTIVNSVIVRMRADPLRSTIRTVAGATEGSGPSSKSTSDGGTAHIHEIDIAEGPPTHDVGLSAPGTQLLHDDTGAGTHTIATTVEAVGAHDHGMAHTHTSTADLSTLYGIFDSSSADTYAATDLQFQVNSGSWTAVTVLNAIGGSGGWYSLDITSDVSDVATLRASSIVNNVTFRVNTSLSGDKSITGATQADPCEITSNGHGFLDDDLVYIFGVTGMTELNDDIYTVANKTANTFELSGVNSSGYGAYTGPSGIARTYKSARITAQIERRTVVQSISNYADSLAGVLVIAVTQSITVSESVTVSVV